VLSHRAAGRGLFEPAVVRRIVAAHQSGENHSERLWALINLEVWQRIFLEGEDAKQVMADGQRAHMPKSVTTDERHVHAKTV
jgi:hypothetical protein